MLDLQASRTMPPSRWVILTIKYHFGQVFPDLWQLLTVFADSFVMVFYDSRFSPSREITISLLL